MATYEPFGNIKWDLVTMQAEEQVNTRITYNVSGLLATYLDLLPTHMAPHGYL